MIIPVQITYRNMKHSEAIDTQIRTEAAKLDEFFDKIVSCRVMVEIPHQHRDRGNSFHIRIALEVPGREIVVNHQPTLHRHAVAIGESKNLKRQEVDAPHKDFYVALHDAFRTVRRQLQDYVARLRNETKEHIETPEGSVTRLFPELDYGFISVPDGREVYFHRNSLRNGDFDLLTPGVRVRFAEEPGEQGPHAAYVRIVSPPAGEAGAEL